jgi:hypothetical protein
MLLETVTMCKFLSAIVMRNGDVLCDPEHTDSHEDLILAHGLRDSGALGSGGRDWSRVEFVPPKDGDIADLDRWTLTLDEDHAKPSWWDESEPALRTRLCEMVRAHIVDDKRPILLGGWWIVIRTAQIGKVVGAAIKAVRDSASLKDVRGSASISDVGDSASISDVRDSASIKGVRGSASIKGVRDSASIKGVWDSASIKGVRGSASISDVRDSVTISNDHRAKKIGGLTCSPT